MFILKKESVHLGNAHCDATMFLPIKDIETGAFEQILNVMRLPFAKHFAVMPDVHQGYGMPIGGVLATSPDVIIPNAVGVDIGCGMCAMRTNIPADALNRDQLRELVGMIKERIPVDFKKRKTPCLIGEMPGRLHTTLISGAEFVNAKDQLGTLGGGNHFIEIQTGSDGCLWVMVHSGSRHMGKAVCDHYNKIAQQQNEMNFSQVPKAWGLAFLHKADTAYHDYIKDMKYCVEYARLNRAKMMNAITDILTHNFTNEYTSGIKILGTKTMDICHNHAQLENHFGHNYMVHRKGVAGPYRADTMGIIPGSMGTPSYIVVYKDSASPLAMLSTSHGAGRAMSRKAAKKNLTLSTEQDGLSAILHDMRSQDKLDEAPSSYKDIEVVMKNQAELCDVVVTLKPIASVKG